jgi:DNA-binding MarR family transcriptional regulator
MSTIDAWEDRKEMIATLSSPKSRGSAAARDTWTLLFQLLLSEREFLVAGWAVSGLTPAQGNLLYLLEPERPTTMVTLAKFLGCHDSNITGLVDRLEARGLVERRNDPADRRVKLIALTDEGAEFRRQALQKVYEPPPWIAALKPVEQRQLAEILRRAKQRKIERPAMPARLRAR